jgi:hypothetical protein
MNRKEVGIVYHDMWNTAKLKNGEISCRSRLDAQQEKHIENFYRDWVYAIAVLHMKYSMNPMRL